MRVLRTLKEVDVCCRREQTRNSIHLLNAYEINTPLTSYHEYNKVSKAKTLVQKLLNGENIALITDAGTPAISDPGEEIVKQCIEAGIKVNFTSGSMCMYNSPYNKWRGYKKICVRGIFTY